MQARPVRLSQTSGALGNGVFLSFQRLLTSLTGPARPANPVRPIQPNGSSSFSFTPPHLISSTALPSSIIPTRSRSISLILFQTAVLPSQSHYFRNDNFNKNSTRPTPAPFLQQHFQRTVLVPDPRRFPKRSSQWQFSHPTVAAFQKKHLQRTLSRAHSFFLFQFA